MITLQITYQVITNRDYQRNAFKKVCREYLLTNPSQEKVRR